MVASTGLRYSVNARVHFDDTRVWVSLRMMPRTEPEVNRLLIQDGRALTPDRPEVLASKDVHDLYRVQVEDTIQVPDQDGKKITLPVIGLAYFLWWVVPSVWWVAVGWKLIRLGRVPARLQT